MKIPPMAISSPLSVKRKAISAIIFLHSSNLKPPFFPMVPLSLDRLRTHHAAPLELRNYITDDSWKLK
uniref:Uncharacterized protein n=1 Tax=Setaria viridis TaxID=4556 RepID=A0A4U6TUK5_SETVI|nr:hypothetical protein SEVIR_7G242550v2 [Setaria viridis]